MDALLVLLSIAALALVAKVIYNRPQKHKLPPGPKPWPVIGNLNLLGSLPHQSLHDLSQNYGEIMLLKFGNFPVVVASSPEIAKQFLQVHDTVCASRPALAAGKFTAYNYTDLSWSPYGPYWRQARKIYHSEVFNPKKLESFEETRIHERKSFLASLYALSGKPVVLRDHLLHLTLSTISRMVFGDKYFSDQSEDGKSVYNFNELREMLDEWFLLNGVINVGDWIPWLSVFDVQGYVRRMKNLHKKLDRFNNYIIDDHQRRKAGAGKDFVAKDVVDMLLQLVEDPSLEVKLSRDNIKGLLQDLLAGGTDTAATAVEWTIHELLRHPHVAKKAKEELDRVIGRNKWVEENDFSQLPYIDAIIKESMRLHPLGTLLTPHYSIYDCKVAGYDISKGTMILINAWSIGRDPNLWDAPLEFVPERFMEKDIDMMGSNFALLPFGSGRRRCPGYNLGLKIVRTTVANLLHGFEMKLVDGMKNEDICMEEFYGLTTHPRHSLSVIMEPTLPGHLY